MSTTGLPNTAESGLDYFRARYFSGVQGRFTSPDRPFADQDVADPQSWNLYATYAAEGSDWSQTFGYGSDQQGNMRILVETGLGSSPIQRLTFNGNNRITGPGTGWSYDAAGNLTDNPLNETFEYDAENRQTEAATTLGTTAYVYDGEGRRVKRAVGSLTTTYVYDAMGRLAAEYGGETGDSNQLCNCLERCACAP